MCVPFKMVYLVPQYCVRILFIYYNLFTVSNNKTTNAAVKLQRSECKFKRDPEIIHGYRSSEIVQILLCNL
jgi:hypothetical protein